MIPNLLVRKSKDLYMFAGKSKDMYLFLYGFRTKSNEKINIFGYRYSTLLYSCFQRMLKTISVLAAGLTVLAAGAF